MLAANDGKMMGMSDPTHLENLLASNAKHRVLRAVELADPTEPFELFLHVEKDGFRTVHAAYQGAQLSGRPFTVGHDTGGTASDLVNGSHHPEWRAVAKLHPYEGSIKFEPSDDL